MGSFVPLLAVLLVLMLVGGTCAIVQLRPITPPNGLPLPPPVDLDAVPGPPTEEVEALVDAAASAWRSGDVLRRLVRSHSLVVWECDETGRIVLSEGAPQVFERLGLPAEGLVGQSLPRDWPLDVPTWDAVRRCLEDGQVHEWMGEGPYTPGHWWLVRVVPIRRGERRLARGLNLLLASLPTPRGYEA